MFKPNSEKCDIKGRSTTVKPTSYNLQRRTTQFTLVTRQ